jgi:hypothetical protein
MGMPTLLDIARLNGNDAVAGLIDEAVKYTPEITLGAARTIKGLNYKALVRTATPTVAFRNANEGTAVDKSAYEQRLYECYILNPQWESDKAVADSYEDGAQAYIAMEGIAMMQAAMLALAKQFYYGVGTGGDAKGFPGLIDVYDSTNMVVDAAGTTASTGSSVWLVKWGPQFVTWLWGNGGALNLSPVSEQRLQDGSNNPYMAYHQEILARPGLQVGHIKSVCRIKKLTADSGKGLTDALLGTAFNKFPAAFRPDVILMTRRSREQLRASRTATNPTGAPAPTPTDWEGVPIVATEALSDTEALTL